MRLVRASIVLVCALVYVAYVFRLATGDFLTAGLGDWIDPYFINALLEHWRHSLLTATDPASPPMYFPVSGTLGYSHGLILYAPIYIALRLAMPPFQACNLTMFVVVLAGSVSVYAFLRKALRLTFVESFLLAAFLCTSQNVVNGGSGNWSQRLSVFLIVPVMLLFVASSAMSSARWKPFVGWLAGFSATLLFTQDFYTAQLAALVAGSLVAGILIVSRERLVKAACGLWRTTDSRPSRWWLISTGIFLLWATIVTLHPFSKTQLGSFTVSASDPFRPLLAATLTGTWFFVRLLGSRTRRESLLRSSIGTMVITYWQENRAYALAVVAGGLAGLLVLLWIYLPAYREHRAFDEAQLRESLVSIGARDLVAMSGLKKILGAYESLRIFGLVILLSILAWIRRSEVGKQEREFTLWCVFLSGMVLLAALDLNGFSAWGAFIAPFPGFGVIRDPRRIIPLFELAMVVVTGVFMRRLQPHAFVRRLTAVILLVLLIGGWNEERFGFGRANATYSQWVDAPIDVDPSCRSFYIKGASALYMSRSTHMWSLYSVDSLFIALKYSIPTLNGYSAWMPEGWRLGNPQEPGYGASVVTWIAQHSLADVCELDIDKRTMTVTHDVK